MTYSLIILLDSELHGTVTQNAFSNTLEGVRIYAEHLLPAFPSLSGPTHPKSSQLDQDQVMWRP